MPHVIQFALEVKDQLRSLRAHERATVLAAIKAQLRLEPLTETRNKKPLRPNPLAPWELRVGDLRVFYDVCLAETPVVNVLGVGRKLGSKLLISGKEIKL